MNIGIIGCGNMGGAMVAHLLSLDIKITVFDVSPKLQNKMQSLGAILAPSAEILAQQSDLLILSLPNANIVQSVMDGIHAHVKKGAVLIDTSTSEPDTTKTIASQAELSGYGFIDAPVSGGPLAAGSGTMTMLVAGNPKHIQKAEFLLKHLTAKIVNVGPSGAGHAAKIANNMLCAANLVLVSEIIRLGEAAGVPAQSLLEGINAGSGRSGVSEVNFPKWILNDGFDSGFTMGLMRKDVNLGVALAEQLNVPTKAFNTIAQLWNDSKPEINDAADFNEITKYIGE